MLAGAAVFVGPFLSLADLARYLARLRDFGTAADPPSDLDYFGVLGAFGVEGFLFLWSIAALVVFFAHKRSARVVLIGLFGVRLVMNVAGLAVQPGALIQWFAIAWSAGLVVYFAFGYQRGNDAAV